MIPSSTTSLTAPTSVVTTGRAQLIALSATTVGTPSERGTDDSANTLKAGVGSRHPRAGYVKGQPLAEPELRAARVDVGHVAGVCRRGEPSTRHQTSRPAAFSEETASASRS